MNPSLLSPTLPSPALPRLRPSPAEALDAFRRIRRFSRFICDFLQPEDCVVQSMPDASPIRWHLAHTTWFFETFVLRSLQPQYRSPSDQFSHLFNSYYNAVGDPFPRHRRGLLSRPTVAEVWQYRQHVDAAVEQQLEGPLDEAQWEPVSPIFQIGLQHEQQHQELMLTDIKHVFSCNPLFPAFDPGGAAGATSTMPALGRSSSQHGRIGPDADGRCSTGRCSTGRGGAGSWDVSDKREPAGAGGWLACVGGLVEIGHAGDGFAYDNETPRHRVWLEPFEMARVPVTNGEFLEFVEGGGYQAASLWLDAGWKAVQQQGIAAPLYWYRRDGEWWEFTLGGLRPLRLDEPVCHVSFFEADAYARWRQCRLPTEAEWEHVATQWIGTDESYGSFAGDAVWHPRPCPPFPHFSGADAGNANRDVNGYGDETAAAAARVGPQRDPMAVAPPRQLFGDVWEWTASAYLGYPGYRPPEGAIGEYNGKFMCNQFVLRGGSVVTSRDHIRATYRNFFGPDARWQFSGIRLAR